METAAEEEVVEGKESAPARFEEEEEGLELSLGAEGAAPSATEGEVVVVVLSPSLCSMSASKSIIRSPMLMSHSL